VYAAEEILQKYGTAEAAIAAAGRTNTAFNLGAAAAVAGAVNSFFNLPECGCHK